ncbi:MAG: transglutaminase domain-containing protein [Endozoicomonas sp.]|uniref:transglutaminase-like domain-containing protein n=1 Tax=Endozoicomonas sp. TaxID=1892382 RepID=UPI003D9BE717
MSVQVMESFRQGILGKGVSLLLSSLFVFVFFLSPTGKAVADNIEKEAEYERRLTAMMESTPEKKLAHRLQKLKEWVADDEPGVRFRERANEGVFTTISRSIGLGDKFLITSDKDKLTALYSGVDEAYTEAWTQWQSLETELKSRDLPAIALERHQMAMAEFKEQYHQFSVYYQQLERTNSDTELQSGWEALGRFLNQQQFQKSYAPFDPNKLPFGTPDSEVREPAVTLGELEKVLGMNSAAGLMVASAGRLPDSVQKALEARNQVLEGHLSDTMDIQINDEIRQLASDLNNNPTEIYAWVHNNIRFIPSYGSIQGGAMTLDTRRGNATDIASLLIGLLRAANIPARYAYGSIEVPADKVMNWVGGVEVPAAAQNLMGQGGIPNTGLLRGGKVTDIRMEHTWVEAWVDFEPSRGVKNRQGDNWIPMDASFKQYEFTQGMDLQEQVPFDAQALVDEIQANSTINEEQGFIQNLPQTAIEQQLQDYQQKLQDYITNQNPDATVGEVLGLQEVKVKPPAPLAAGLPYKVLVTSERFAEVPEKLRHKFKYQLQTQLYGNPDVSLFNFEQPTVKLAGKKLALSFRPSTEEDEAIIESYLPQPNEDGSPIDPSQLPDTLPGYLIDMTAEFTLDGEVELTADAGKMGTELYSTLGLYSPTHGWTTANNKPVAGEYRAIGLDLQGVSESETSKLQKNVSVTKDKLSNAEFDALSQHGVVGDLLYATILSYFAQNDVHDQVSSENSDVVQYRAPSFGLFMTNVTPQYWFGMPRDVRFGGLVMDVDNYSVISVHKSNERKLWSNYNFSIGKRSSAMEHIVPEQMFSTSESSAYGISAMKALLLAAQEGQRILSITRDNLEEAMQILNLSDDVEREIKQGVSSGKVVTAHEKNIAYKGWVGAGYLIIDPDTGAGAYKISGGENGGFIELVSKVFEWLGIGFFIKELLAIIAGSLGIAAVFSSIGGVLFFLAFAMNVYDLSMKCRDATAAVIFSILYTVVNVLVIGLLALVAGPIGAAIGLFILGYGGVYLKDWILNTPLCAGDKK